jgi:uncharacterized damage-inducible protein DinB
MSETERIWDLLQRSFEGNEAWKCPSLRDLLAGVTASQAAAHPIAGAPSIWELLLHTTAYEHVVRRRLGGEAWLEAKLGFGEARRALRQTVAAFPDARLAEAVPGREYTYYVMLHGAVEHALYHAGQVEMLMLAQGVRPAASPMASREALVPPA